MAGDTSSSDTWAEANALIEKADREQVRAAVTSGTIPAHAEKFWLASLEKDRSGTRRILAEILARGSTTKSAPPRALLASALTDDDASPLSHYIFTGNGEGLAVEGQTQQHYFRYGERLTGVASADIQRLVSAGAAQHVGPFDREAFALRECL